MSEEIVEIRLDLIVPIEGIRERLLSKTHVESLVATNEPEKWPPVVVTLQNLKYGRVTGQHRVVAARELKLKTMRCVVRTYNSREDILLDRWIDNTRNGLPLTKDERKDLAFTLHQLNPDMSFREIGKKVGLHHTTIKSAIDASSALEQDEDEYEDEEEREVQKKYQDYAKSLMKALANFYEHESAFIGTKGGTGSENKRAKILAKCVSSPSIEVVGVYESLAHSLNKAANMIREKIQPGE